MTKIIPKLNLNKTPALVESNSLIFAKNIRLDVDGSIHRDYGILPMSLIKSSDENYDFDDYSNIIHRIIKQIEKDYEDDSTLGEYYSKIIDKLKSISVNNAKCQIVGVVADSNDFYLFIYGTDISSVDKSCIIKYDEKEDKFYPCNCNWNWSGGIIDGYIINSLVGDKILSIAESNTSKLVPLKFINLNISKFDDDETIYTQTPNIPITNLKDGGRFTYSIPNGVYQFFVRYRIKDDFYTDWFPASKELFIGNDNSVITSFGTLKYTNINRDSDNSFVLSIEHLVDANIKNYQDFQIGFILSHDDATYARAWKHFDFSIKTINFDYNSKDAEEIEVSEILKLTYGLYNVSNITSFKNKIYISNYTETDFNNAELQEKADDVEVVINTKSSGNAYGKCPIIPTQIAGEKAFSGLIIEGVETPFIGENNIFHKIINTTSLATDLSLVDRINKALKNEEVPYGDYCNLYGINIQSTIDSIEQAKRNFESKFKDVTNKYYSRTHEFDYLSDNINSITINGVKSNAEDIIPFIYNSPRFLNEKCNWIDASGKIYDEIKITIYRKACVKVTTTYTNNNDGFKPSVDLDEEGNNPDNDNISLPDPTITFHNYEQNINIKFVAYEYNYNSDNAELFTNNTTLIPYQKYKFYIHFVKSNGETTNGYYCSNIGEVTIPYMESCSVIYPTFKKINIPNDYVACFFSILHTKNITSTVVNVETVDTVNEGTCFDINMMLVPNSRNIHVVQGSKSTDDETENPLPEDTEIETLTPGKGPIFIPKPPSVDTGTTEQFIPKVETHSGKYYYSSDPSVPKYFGADGVLTFDKSTFDTNKLIYTINDYSIPETDILELIKCTPYLNEKNLVEKDGITIFEDYSQMNLLGYICGVSPLLRKVCIDYYSDGNSVFYKEFDNTVIDQYNNVGAIYLDELSKYNDADSKKKLSNFILKSSNTEYVYSNFNLNYVTLSEEPKMVIKTFYNRAANDTGSISEKQENDSRTIILRLLASQLMNGVYQLPSMYKSFIRKTYSTYKNNEFTKFDNTVRSSILYGDENRTYVVKFEANDYYNIPTNRGIITNMIAIGDNILVHTEDSMFKFSGSNNLQSSQGEIQTSESQPFDTGVSEIFGSDYGFAGLQNKQDHIVTEMGYIFFDRDSKIIYIYSGQGQIIKISESIEKLFRYKDISNIYFANDYYNNRFFVCINFVDENKITLSFNITEKSKAFVSIHDFWFDNAFNTKTKCYFISRSRKNICKINKEYKGLYTELEIKNNQSLLYPISKNTKQFKINAVIPLSSIKMFYNVYDSIVDVINNEQYENIKTLNSIDWCGGNIESEFTNISPDIKTSTMIAEDILSKTPCKELTVYTDTTLSKVIDCDSRSNDFSINNPNNYMYPRYNQGIWTLNYFRNILNAPEDRRYVSDINSLIEGKYFVIRFIFDTEFKLETITFNYNRKI